MPTQLNKELTKALQSAGHEGLQVVDPETNRKYRVVDEDIHRRALSALRAQEDRDAIAEGIAQMETAQGKAAEEVFETLRKELGFPEESANC